MELVGYKRKQFPFSKEQPLVKIPKLNEDFEEEIQNPKEEYLINLEMKESENGAIHYFRGSCGLKEDESDQASFFLESLEGYYLQSFCYIKAGVIFHSSPKWPQTGEIQLKIFQGEDKIYCERKINFSRSEIKDNILEFTCRRTSGVKLLFENEKLKSINVKLTSSYNEVIQNFKIIEYPDVQIPIIDVPMHEIDVKMDDVELDKITPPNSPDVINIVTPSPSIPKKSKDQLTETDSISLSSDVELESSTVKLGSQNNPLSIDDNSGTETSDNDSNTEEDFKNTKKGKSDEISEDENKTTPPTIEIEDEDLFVKNDDKEKVNKSKENEMIFTPYIPKRVKIHCVHPAKIVESTTLAGAELPPLKYTEKLPDICLKKGNKSALSSVQLETVKFVGLRHQSILENNERAGYFIGDGTGVGKGRQIAAIITDNYLKGRKKAIWISASSSLLRDSKRDISDIGVGNEIELFTLSSNGKSIPQHGVLFVTYSLLVGKGNKKK